MEPDSRERTVRVGAGLVVGVLVGAALTYVGSVDPHRPGAILPACPFKLLTGWNCPGCGGLRMTHDLLHLDLAAAAVDNIFLLVGIPALAMWFLWRRSRGGPFFSVASAVLIAVLVIVWTVVRNLPGFPLVPTVLPAGV
jgi:hypothetical protein